MGVRNLFFKVGLSQNPSGNLTKLYITALTVVALLTILGQVLIQQSIKDQLTDSRVVNFAGKQRFKSQEISKLVLLIQYNYKHNAYSDKAKYLDSLLITWQKEHLSLERGDEELNLPGNNSDKILSMFQDANLYFYKILNNARKIVKYVEKNNSENSTNIELAVRTVMDNEKFFLDRMDAIVQQYDEEAGAKVVFLRKVETVLLIITIIILVLEGFFIFRPAVNKIKDTMQGLISSEKKASNLATELYKANLSLKESFEREQIVRSTALIEGQEKERKFIAMELHDGLVQLLTALKINLQSLAFSDSKFQSEKLENTLELASESISEARRVSHSLMPSVLYDFGIASALKHLARDVTGRTKINAEFINNVSFLKLHKNDEIHLYRIAQEAISNAVKYSKCSEINISLEEDVNNFYLQISDNGKGFDLFEKSTDRKSRLDSGNGLANMKERASILNGQFEIESGKDKGTTIKVTLTK